MEYGCSVYNTMILLFTVTLLSSFLFFHEIFLDAYGELVCILLSMLDSWSHRLSNRFSSSSCTIHAIASHCSSYRSGTIMIADWYTVHLVVWGSYKCSSEGMHRFNSERDWGDGTWVCHLSNTSRGSYSLWNGWISCEGKFAHDASECPFITIDDPVSGCIYSR